MPKTILICAAALTLTVTAGLAAEAMTGTAAVTDSSTALAARVDKIFEPWNRSDSPGCALSVFRTLMKDGAIAYEHAYGMADLDHGVALSPASVFHVASVSKQFTAASIVLLVQRGQLSLDDEVHKYIPELPDFGVPITIRHLIFHTSGLRDQWALLGLAGWRYSLDLITDDDIISLITRQKQLNFQPGDQHLYSNTGYTLLAQIVKRVSGMSLREFTTRNIFEPLGMRNTHFRDDHAEIVRNNAYGYERASEQAPYRLSITNFDTVGATSLHTTVEDLARWDGNFYNPIVGGPAFIAQMLERGKLNNGEQLDYAFALEHGTHKGLKTVGHSGADAGYRADFVRFPDQHLAVAVLCNFAAASPGVMGMQVADLYLANEVQPSVTAKPAVHTPQKLSERQLTRFVGLYWNRDDDYYAEVFLKDGKLQEHSNGDDEETTVLAPETDTVFHEADKPNGDQTTFRFEPAPGTAAWRIALSYGEDKPAHLEQVQPFRPSALELAGYAGAYVSDEIDPVYRLTVQNDKLVLSRLKLKPETLHPDVRDVFSGEVGTVRFTSDGDGHISGFVLNAGRIRNFRFSRQSH